MGPLENLVSGYLFYLLRVFLTLKVVFRKLVIYLVFVVATVLISLWFF